MFRIRKTMIVMTFGWLAAMCSCDVDLLLNQTAVFGPEGGLAQAGAPLGSGARGTFRVLIENNTPFRAIFTMGVFDNTDERTTPAFVQSSPNSEIVFQGSDPSLEMFANTGVLTFPCARVFSIGSPSLINLVEENPGAFVNVIDDAAMIDGVGFSSQGILSEDASTPREGFAAGFEAHLGVDFNCGSLLYLTIEFAEIGSDRFVVNLANVFPAGREEE